MNISLQLANLIWVCLVLIVAFQWSEGQKAANVCQ